MMITSAHAEEEVRRAAPVHESDMVIERDYAGDAVVNIICQWIRDNYRRQGHDPEKISKRIYELYAAGYDCEDAHKIVQQEMKAGKL